MPNKLSVEGIIKRSRKFVGRTLRHALLKPALTDLILYANSFCNASCQFCDVGSSKQGIRRAIKDAPLYLDIDLLEKVLDDGLIYGNRLCVIFLMTEPLLAPKLPLMLEACKTRGHWTKVTTNGLLLRKRIGEIAASLDAIQVSIDGLEEAHDSIRGKGFFRAAIAGLKAARLAAPDLEIQVNYTITPRNHRALCEFLRFIDGLGLNIDLLKFQLMDFVSESMAARHNREYPWIAQTVSSINDNYRFSHDDIKDLCNEIEAARAFTALSIKRVAFKPPIASIEELKRYFDSEGEPISGADKCYAPWTQLAINTAGDVFWHMRCFNGYALGNARKSTLKEIFHGQKAEHFREELRRSGFAFPACTRCCSLMPMD